jgi:hypothetical protein
MVVRFNLFDKSIITNYEARRKCKNLILSCSSLLSLALGGEFFTTLPKLGPALRCRGRPQNLVLTLVLALAPRGVAPA